MLSIATGCSKALRVNCRQTSVQRTLREFSYSATRLRSFQPTSCSQHVHRVTSSPRQAGYNRFTVRDYSNLTQTPKEKEKSTSVSPSKTDAAKTAKDLGSEKNLNVADQRRKDWEIVKRLLVNIWPPGDWGVRSRVLLGFGLLVGGKVGITLLLTVDAAK